MREIVFRGKTANGVWVHGSLAYSDNIEPAIYFEFGKGTVKTFDFVYVRPETVGQFTGLYDGTTWEELDEQERKDWVMKGHMPSEWIGKKIYEGDIVKVCSGWNEKATIVYDDSVARFLAKFKKWGAKSISKETVFEVIGTIHDNPGLQEVGE